MNRKDRLRVSKTPDTTHIDESLVLLTPRPKARVSKSIEPLEAREKSEPRRYLPYALALAAYTALLWMLFRRPGDGGVVADLVKEINLVRQENLRISSRRERRETNYARIEQGAVVETDPDALYSYGLLGFRRHKDPATVFSENVGVGECLAFRGARFRLGIAFDRDVRISRIALFHPVTSDVSSAVHEFDVVSRNGEEETLLGEFRYDSRCGYQVFEFEECSTRTIDIVVKSNGGNSRYTCVYKVYLLGE